MKNVFVLLVMLVLSAVQAQAQSATDFDYTGDNAANYGTATNPVYYPTATVIGVGGPSNDGGAAEQFTISSVTNISSLDVNAIVFGSGNQPSQSTTPTTFVYQIYSGSSYTVEGTTNLAEPVPNLSTLMTTSSPLTFADPSSVSPTTTTATYSNINVPLNTTLQPGTYWLAEDGNGPAVVDATQTYIDPPSGMPIAAAPEPDSWILFIFGIAGILLFKRKSFFQTA